MIKFIIIHISIGIVIMSLFAKWWYKTKGIGKTDADAAIFLVGSLFWFILLPIIAISFTIDWWLKKLGGTD